MDIPHVDPQELSRAPLRQQALRLAAAISLATGSVLMLPESAHAASTTTGSIPGVDVAPSCGTPNNFMDITNNRTSSISITVGAVDADTGAANFIDDHTYAPGEHKTENINDIYDNATASNDANPNAENVFVRYDLLCGNTHPATTTTTLKPTTTTVKPTTTTSTSPTTSTTVRPTTTTTAPPNTTITTETTTTTIKETTTSTEVVQPTTSTTHGDTTSTTERSEPTTTSTTRAATLGPAATLVELGPAQKVGANNSNRNAKVPSGELAHTGSETNERQPIGLALLLGGVVLWGRYRSSKRAS